jgi:hypothetical protein
MHRHELRRKHLWIAALAIIALSLAVGVTRMSRASFSDSSQSTVNGAADTIGNYLHLYSQSTDPVPPAVTYETQQGTATPAATGMDGTLAVNLGHVGKKSKMTVAPVFTFVPVSPLPRTLGSVTVTLALVADPSGWQPLQGAVITNLNGSGALNPRTITPGQKLAFQVQVKITPPFPDDVWLTPHLRVTVTYAGFATTYYQYDVPITMYTGA